MKKTGFTLVELMITILIVAVMVAVGTPVYQQYVESAKMAEAYQVLGTIAKNQRTYFLDQKKFCTTNWNGGPGAPWVSNSSADTWPIFGLPVAVGSITNFKYVAIGGHDDGQHNGCDDTIIYSGLNTALYPFNQDGTNGHDANADFCTGATNPSPVTVGTGGGASGAIFTPATFGVTMPSSGRLDWVVMLAQGYLKPGTSICKYVAIAMEVVPANNITTPSFIGGFIQFDYNYNNQATTEEFLSE